MSNRRGIRVCTHTTRAELMGELAGQGGEACF
jgi:hypothetical protein